MSRRKLTKTPEVGDVFNGMTVINFETRHPKLGNLFKIKCFCGTEKVMRETYLTRKDAATSCGCLSAKGRIIPNGSKFGMLTVTGFSHVERNSKYYFADCDCGKKTLAHSARLKTGAKRSCGCLSKQVHQKMKLPGNSTVINHILKKYKYGARKRNFAFDLDKDLLEVMVLGDCYYCGIGPSNVARGVGSHDPFQYNGIDRVNPQKGYSLDNVVTCCRTCNTAKRNMSPKEWLNWVARISSHTPKWSGNWKDSLLIFED